MRKLCISALVVAFVACRGLGSARAGEHGHNSVMSEVDRVCEPHPDMAAHEAKFDGIPR